jgi:hypothetical protein
MSERLTAVAEGESALAMSMTEEAFRSFYDRTARSVWGYLARLTGDPALADDLLQDAYYRFSASGRAVRKRSSPPQQPLQDCDEPRTRRRAPASRDAVLRRRQLARHSLEGRTWRDAFNERPTSAARSNP